MKTIGAIGVVAFALFLWTTLVSAVPNNGHVGPHYQETDSTCVTTITSEGYWKDVCGQ